ncbi:hypothetical protein IJ556_08190 [bacterium]|nr:hypothetical protein [bacterium]
MGIIMDYEDAILARQESIEALEDGCGVDDDCENCPLLSECRNASHGKCEYPICPLSM